MATSIKGTVDIAIITIKEEEFEAVLRHFPTDRTESGLWEYNLHDHPQEGRGPLRIATVRCLKQATNEAQSITGHLIEDLDPRLILVVGIAGALPAVEYTLGDVVVSSRVYDLNVGAVLEGDRRQFAITGEPIHEDLAPLVANIPAYREQLEGWNSSETIGRTRPSFSLEQLQERLSSRPDWNQTVEESLNYHFGPDRANRRPLVTAGPIASSDDLIKDPVIVQHWKSHARDIYAVEMEAAGVHRGAKRRGKTYPVLSIRGLSDVVGLKRDHRFTQYACDTAAAFTRYFVDVLGERYFTEQDGQTRPQSKPAASTSSPEAVEQQPEDIYLTLLERLNRPWHEALSQEQRNYLQNYVLEPGKHYPSPPWVLAQLSEAADFLKVLSSALRGSARWPESYRLSLIRQLSTAHLGTALDAGHSRLSHSLGTLDIATCLLSAIHRNSPDFLDFEDAELSPWVIASLTLAFLHDRYHGPLGHSLDPLSWFFFLASERGPQGSGLRTSLLRLDKELLTSQIREARHSSQHPIYRLVNHVLQVMSPRFAVPAAKEVLKALVSLVDVRRTIWVPEKYRFLADIIDSELDADRLDYLWRDLFHLGDIDPDQQSLAKALGFPDSTKVGQLVGSAQAMRQEDGVRLAFLPAHAATADALLSLRQVLHVRCYEAQQKCIYDQLATRTIYRVFDEAKLVKDGQLISGKLGREVLNLTDQGLYHFLQEASAQSDRQGQPLLSPASQRMIQDLIQARPWTAVWQCQLSNPQWLKAREARLQQFGLLEKLAKDFTGTPQEVLLKAQQKLSNYQGKEALAALYQELSLPVPTEIHYSEYTEVVDFYLPFRGSFESLRRAEQSLWRELRPLEPVQQALGNYRRQEAWTADTELPDLMVMGMVNVALPAPELINYTEEPAPIEGGEAPSYQQLSESLPTFMAFVAVHPCLAVCQELLQEKVDSWFKSRSYLNL